MFMFLIQSAILLAIAFIIGAIIGCLLKRMFASDAASVPVATAAVATAATAAAVTARAVEAPKPVAEPEPAPAPVVAPVMAAATVAQVESQPKPKAVAKPKASAKPKPVVAKPKAAIASVKDDLKLIVGIGPVNERKLNAHGVATFAQIAGWKKPDIVEAEKYLEFDGRIEREEWVRQAKKLAAGGKSEDAAELARQGKGGKAKSAARVKAAATTFMAKPASTSVASKAKPAGAVSPVGPKGKGTKAPASGLMSAAKPASPSLAKAKSTTVKPVTKPMAAKPTTAKSTAAKPMAAKPMAAKPAAAKKSMAVRLDKPVGGKPDNLTLINGIGNVIEKKLHAMGVFHFEQIANWTDAMAEEFSKAVGFPGRAKREGWMKEAALFAKGGTTEHARKVEAGEIPTSRKSTTAEKGRK